MTKRKALIIGLVLTTTFLILMGSNMGVKAAWGDPAYEFEVDEMIVDVWIKKDDGSIDIDYNITFTNTHDTQAIDIVDIGFPTNDYKRDSVEAWIDGHKISSADIKESTEISIGVEIHLKSYKITPGNSGTLRVKGNNPNMIYQNIIDHEEASLQFAPTWFDDDFCEKYKYLRVNFIFPSGSKVSEIKTPDSEPHDKDGTRANGSKAYVSWEKQNVAMKKYTFEAYFPISWVDEYIPWNLNPVFIGLVVLFVFLGIIGACIIGWGIHKVIENKRYERDQVRYRRERDKYDKDLSIYKSYRRSYSPPKISMECLAVNKNLSVVEAAILKDPRKINKILFLITFSLIRTGHLKVLEAKETPKFEALTTDWSNLRIYQRQFLGSILKTGARKGQLGKTKLTKMLRDLVILVKSHMRGYDRAATIKYYDQMIAKAWQKVKKLPKEIDFSQIEKELEWLMLDEKFEEKSKTHLATRYYRSEPTWYPHYYYYHYYYGPRHYHTYHGMHGRTAAGPPVSHINIFTFADSMARGMENMAHCIAGGLSNIADGIARLFTPPRPRSPPPRPSSPSPPREKSRSSSRSSGSSCNCACACVSCACACAGGGR